jgi:hypothetical protein
MSLSVKSDREIYVEHGKVLMRFATVLVGPNDAADVVSTVITYGHLFEGLDEAATDRLEATYAASDVHAMCTREDSGVTALAAE